MVTITDVGARLYYRGIIERDQRIKDLQQLLNVWIRKAGGLIAANDED